MPDRIIISDTSSLIALSNIGELKIVRQIYKEVVITPEIATEYGMEIPDWIKIKQVNDSQKLRLLDLGLDLGESSAITLALEYDSSLLIEGFAKLFFWPSSALS
jgi:predicted nucleic acid-binding protein